MRLVDADAIEKYVTNVMPDTAFSAYGKGIYDALTHLLNFVRQDVPTAHTEPHWIPCSEQMPENLQTVIAVWVNHKPEPYYSEIKDKPFTAPCIYYNG